MSSSARGCEAGILLMIVFYDNEIKPPHFTTKGSKPNVHWGNICHRFDCAPFQAISNVIAERVNGRKRLVDAFYRISRWTTVKCHVHNCNRSRHCLVSDCASHLFFFFWQESIAHCWLRAALLRYMANDPELKVQKWLWKDWFISSVNCSPVALQRG